MHLNWSLSLKLSIIFCLWNQINWFWMYTQKPRVCLKQWQNNKCSSSTTQYSLELSIPCRCFLICCFDVVLDCHPCMILQTKRWCKAWLIYWWKEPTYLTRATWKRRRADNNHSMTAAHLIDSLRTDRHFCCFKHKGRISSCFGSADNSGSQLARKGLVLSYESEQLCISPKKLKSLICPVTHSDMWTCHRWTPFFESPILFLGSLQKEFSLYVKAACNLLFSLNGQNVRVGSAFVAAPTYCGNSVRTRPHTNPHCAPTSPQLHSLPDQHRISINVLVSAARDGDLFSYTWQLGWEVAFIVVVKWE